MTSSNPLTADRSVTHRCRVCADIGSGRLFLCLARRSLRTASMTSARESNTMTALADGTVLITGGDSVINDVQTGIGTAELFRP